MEVLAIIPARGGSKSIPKKNIIEVGGRPLISYTIDHALDSKLINRLIVSTDDDEIADICLKYGAEVPFKRPSEFAQDLSPDIDVFYHALTWLKENEGYVPDVVLNHRAIFPIRKPETIDRAIQLFIDTPTAESLRSMVVPRESPFKMWKELSGGFVEPLNKIPGMQESFNMPRQMLPQVYWQIGYVDMTRSWVITDLHKMNGANMLAFIIDEEWTDIDYPEDVEEAERLLKEGFKEKERRLST